MTLSTSKGFRFSHSHRFNFISSLTVSFAVGFSSGSTIKFAVYYVRCRNSVEIKASHFSSKELAVFSTPSFT